MRFYLTRYPIIKRIFAFYPHYCDDVKAYVWLEKIYKTTRRFNAGFDSMILKDYTTTYPKGYSHELET